MLFLLRRDIIYIPTCLEMVAISMCVRQHFWLITGEKSFQGQGYLNTGVEASRAHPLQCLHVYLCGPCSGLI